MDIWLIIIMVLYVSVGGMAAAGSIFIAKSLFSPKIEQLVFAGFLVPIAAFYLVFTAHFGDIAAWRAEWLAVALFTALATLGARFPVILAVGYLLHGAWDALHELSVHGDIHLVGANTLTEIPLAYGFLCATYDVLMAAYFYSRREIWRAAWG